MPSRTTSCVRRPCSRCTRPSSPVNSMVPVEGTRPSTDLTVVVLPAPLRPSSAVTPPRRTVRSTPCRMWLPERRTCTSASRSSGGAVTASPLAPRGCSLRSSLAGGRCDADSQSVPQVGLLDGGIAGHPRRGVQCQQRAVVHHGHPVGQAEQDVHVVLDHEHGL